MDLFKVLDHFRQEAQSKRDLGDKFESLIRAYLRTDPMYSEQFSDVWLWSEWPLHWGQDTGIDVVARDRLTGKYCAIQCKFYDPLYNLQKGDIDSFFTASGKTFKTTDGNVESFTLRMIVSTTDKWSKNAEDALTNQVIPVIRLRVQDLAQSPIDWGRFAPDNPGELSLLPKKQPRPHQLEAIENVLEGFKLHDRGKLVMACGTGKTFTALKIAETVAGNNGIVLFLVPSISLVSQTLREWTAETVTPFHAFAVCSDTKVGKHSEAEDISVHDLAIPATTDPKRLVAGVKGCKGDRPMTVIFSTYQSISVVADAQREGLPEIDIIVCDEAHRTTGVIVADKEESHFVRVHNQDFIKGKKRLYMTATPRIYADSAKSKAEENEAVLCSMDDEALYGPIFHRLGFGDAVGAGLLADYKVLVLAVDEKHISRALQKSLADQNKEINLDDAVKIVGCWNGLAKRMSNETSWEDDPAPMHRAVAFSRSIKDSKLIAAMFQQVMDEYIEHHEDESDLRCEVHHVDGSFNVLMRNQELDWLKENPGENVCRILSNARCLSEGVDVPALDAVLFLNPRDSVVDVVQSVGRVMRTAPHKKYGYVILPIGIPAGIPPEEALRDNQKYRIVWQVLQALRAHDDRFNATVNKIELNKKRPDQIQVIGVGGGTKGDRDKPVITQISLDMPELEEWKEAIYARIVEKCGDRRYWEQWARDVARIAEHHTARITALLETSSPARQAFNRFLSGLHENINPSIGIDEAIEMLSQHLVTRPVFDALFENYSFTKHNPVSLALQEVLDVLESQALEKEVESLQGFYESVGKRVKGIDNAEGRQKVVIELYDKFFKLAFPKMSERLGIVYTPVEIVDFIVRSAEEALRDHFGVGLTYENVHILDPFVGTGTFIVRLLQSGLISPEDLERKYQKELHANEIVLLAYYIAAINIEETYHGIIGKDYEPFNGIVLTDTFQMTEGNKFTDVMLPENNQRARRQKEQDIRVIVANPPYSAGQGSENDNNKNLKYENLDRRITGTYAAYSTAILKNSLYDSYIKAIRWASDRIGDRGVIGFVTNGSFIDSNVADGFRKCLAEDFSNIYCFNLRGNARTSGEQRKREGGNVFDVGSRAPVAITILIKNPARQGFCAIKYRDIGDYLNRKEKLELIRQAKSIGGLDWITLEPNTAYDWINLRSPEFDKFIPLGEKEKGLSHTVFDIYSSGVKTNRDAWVYNFSSESVVVNMQRMIGFYNEQVQLFSKLGKIHGNKVGIERFIDNDPRKISWTRELKNDLVHGRHRSFNVKAVVPSMYRPYCKEWLYFDRYFNNTVYQMPKLFPDPSRTNLVMSMAGVGVNKDFSVIISNTLPDVQLQANGQCFPLYWYDRVEDARQITLSSSLVPEVPDAEGYIRRDAVTGWALDQFCNHYGDQSITKEDIFYYIYGVLHSPEYRQEYEASLKKMLPRIPFASDFWGFSRAGRELAEWHLNYETVEPYPLVEAVKDPSLDAKTLYRVEKMAFPKNGKDVDKTTIVYNSRVKLTGIPPEAYEYVVNGKSGIEWVMDRYAVTTDKDSGIRNDPNAWSDDPRYIVDLVKRVVRVSMETVRIVKGLPQL